MQHQRCRWTVWGDTCHRWTICSRYSGNWFSFWKHNYTHYRRGFLEHRRKVQIYSVGPLLLVRHSAPPPHKQLPQAVFSAVPPRQRLLPQLADYSVMRRPPLRPQGSLAPLHPLLAVVYLEAQLLPLAAFLEAPPHRLLVLARDLPATGGLFGAPATSTTPNLFGNTAAPASTTTGGLLGPSTTTNLFGGAATSATAASQPATTSSLFGASTAATGLLGSTAPATTGGLFGTSTTPASSSLFGATTAGATTSLSYVFTCTVSTVITTGCGP
eukprot:Platyproteum_vivax@DN7063_c0_g1_i2.p1